MPRPYGQTCPIARTLDIVGDRWTILILRDLFRGSSRFQEFLQASPGLPPKLLSDRLKKLQRHGLAERVVYSQHPLRASYRLTDKGRSLAPVVQAMIRWGMDHCFDDDPEARDTVRRAVASYLQPEAAGSRGQE